MTEGRQLDVFSLNIELEKLRLTGSSNVVGPIYFRFGDVAFPEEGWSDFPLVIIGWWMNDLGRMWQKAREVNLVFMDGSPYIRATLQKDHMVMLKAFATDSCIYSGTFELVTICDEVVNTALELANWQASNPLLSGQEAGSEQDPTGLLSASETLQSRYS